jgi:3-methyladenine DNA glycosylase AlkD
VILSDKAQNIYLQITKEGTKLGDLRKIAKEVKKNQQLAEELWGTGKFYPRLLAILIMDVKQLDSEVVDNLLKNIDEHQPEERLQLADWLMANQLMKDKKLIALIQSWQNNTSALKRRIFWYYQGRLRWIGQIPPDNTKELLVAIEEKILGEEPEVQWAMNFTAGWIGIFDTTYRSQCIRMGEELGLYKDEVVPRNCTPNYLPKFIEIEVEKRKLL